MTRGEPLEFSSAITCCQILPGFDWRVCETFLTMYLGASQDQNIYPTPHLRVLLRPWKLFSATLYHCLWWDPAPTKKGSSLQTVERNRQGFHEYKQPSLLATLNATSLIPWGAPPPLLWRVSFSWGGGSRGMSNGLKLPETLAFGSHLRIPPCKFSRSLVWVQEEKNSQNNDISGHILGKQSKFFKPGKIVFLGFRWKSSKALLKHEHADSRAFYITIHLYV